MSDGSVHGIRTKGVPIEFREAPRCDSIFEATARVGPNVRVIRGFGYGLDEEAIEAVRQWTFAPGVKNGMPVDGKIQVETVFRLP